MKYDAVNWLAGELSRREETHIIAREHDMVKGVVPTAAGPSDVVYQQFSPTQASISLHVAPEPDGAPKDLILYHEQMNDYRATLFDRRIDNIDGQVFFGRDLTLPESASGTQEMLGGALADLAEELPSVRSDYLQMTKGLRAKRHS